MPLSQRAESDHLRSLAQDGPWETTLAGVAEWERISEGLVSFVSRTFMVERSDIDMDKSLIDQGIIDSFGLIEIATFIDDTFGAKIQESDMTREAFGSMNKMATFVARRRRGEV